QGAALSLPAAIMPGPFQAFLISQALKNGWKRTLPVALAPLVTDGPIIALVLFILTQTPQWFLDILRIAGGLFILYLARGVFVVLKTPCPTPEPSGHGARQTLLNAIVLNFLNPNPYIFWSVVAGPIMLSGWRESARLGIAFIVGFYGTFVCILVVLIIVFATAGRLNPKVNRILTAITGVALAVFGVYQITVGIIAVT
ncbi:MAG: LysE family transporter, partial [Deltaproteobacteria bacterium]|nr:LysE family transporter [Deltaproteobacteria bacterium]